MTRLIDTGRVHLVGVGGAGMSGLARIMLAQGIPVSGSDAKDSRRLAALRALGADARVGHAVDVLDAPGSPVVVVVASTAIQGGNPEIVEAQRRGLPVWTRAEALNAVMEGLQPIAIAGTHGKTTTTSMVTVALQACGVDPSFAIGSELQSSGTNAHLGSGDYFVVEADESDGSFLAMSPVVAVVTNVEADHLDYWSGYADIEDAFVRFCDSAGSRDGLAVLCADDPGARAVAERVRASGTRVVTYGESADADFRVSQSRAERGGWSFEAIHRGVRLGRVRLRVPGRHNALNATAALAVGISLGFPAADLVEGLESFTGTQRRFEFRGSVGDVRVYDDYAHHPTEVEATLRAAREVAGDGRVVVAFQAHRYSRTAAFAQEFGRALGLADEVVVLEVYSAGEQAIPGASGSVIAAAIPLPADRVEFQPSWSHVPASLVARVRPGDLVMTMGAGDVGMLVPEILDLMRESRA
ncbi:MAG: UDP-N-acetylmuramate--L-alanine ligase [Candidatus Nanopelagicales bacterium]